MVDMSERRQPSITRDKYGDGTFLNAMMWSVGSGFVMLATLIVILPINKRLLDPALKGHDVEGGTLLARWGLLHAVRTVVSTVAVVMF